MAESTPEFAARSSQHPGCPFPGLAPETWEWAAPAVTRAPIPETTTDVCIAGGGPAGLAGAIAATLRGLRVEVVDAMQPPVDKACGEGLMPDSISALAKLGIFLDDRAVTAGSPVPPLGHPLQGIRFLNAAPGANHAVAQASFPAHPGHGISRLLLHQCLLDRATALGVRFRWRTVVQAIEQGTGRTGRSSPERITVHTTRGPLHARFLIGADGHQSRVRTWAGLDRAALTARRIGLRQHFAIAPWSSFVEVYWSAHGQAYITPVSPHEVCVAFIARQRFPNVAAALACFPLLHNHLAAALPSDSARGSITLSRKLHRVTRGNIALLGDASGSVDAVTGEGLALCFRQALALADALAAGDLACYQRAHTALRRRPHFMAAGLLLLDRSPRLRAHVFALFARRPQLFRHLLELHIGAAPLGGFGSSASGRHRLAS